VGQPPARENMFLFSSSAPTTPPAAHKKSQVEPSQSSKVIFYSLPLWAKNPKLKSNF
jgi:hypothetical protein